MLHGQEARNKTKKPSKQNWQQGPGQAYDICIRLKTINDTEESYLLGKLLKKLQVLQMLMNETEEPQNHTLNILLKAVHIYLRTGEDAGHTPAFLTRLVMDVMNKFSLVHLVLVYHKLTLV